MIDICDSGKGMDARDARRAFAPFYTTKVGHDGLGLYFCKMLVERNGGLVEITSRTGEGTTLRMRFPCASPKTAERRV